MVSKPDTKNHTLIWPKVVLYVLEQRMDKRRWDIARAKRHRRRFGVLLDDHLIMSSQ